MAEFPKDPAALAQRYWGMWADALRDYRAALRLNPEDAEVQRKVRELEGR